MAGHESGSVHLISKRRIWASVAVLAGAGCTGLAIAEGGEGGENGTPSLENDFPGGTFATALHKVLEGEGGEGGLGMTRLNRMVTIPALNGAQVWKALEGNTLRRNNAFALTFGAGTFRGWQHRWEKVDAQRCASAKKGDPTLEMEDGECWHRLDFDIPRGTWRIEHDMLCTEPALIRVAEGQRCVSLALVLDNVALFGADGKMIGKGAELVPGEHLEPVLKRD